MVKEVEKLIKIVGKDNLLEALFIREGSFQHANLHNCIDHRNHIDLSEFINKKEQEPLDKYFNLKFSLQGLFLIYVQTYRVFVKNAHLNTQEVIDKIYAAVESGKTTTTYNALGELLREIVDQAKLTEDQKKLKLLNILANPKDEILFNNNNDFGKQVLNNVKKLLKINYANEFDKEFNLCKEVINHYYSIHSIKVDKDIALLFSSYGIFFIHTESKDILPLNQYINERAKAINTPLYYNYTIELLKVLRKIELPHRNGFTKYTLNYQSISELNETFDVLITESNLYNQDFLCPKNIKDILEQLLKNQNSDEFEQLVTNPENVYYSVVQKEKDHKNMFCKLALDMFMLSVGLCAADYFLMEQKLFNSMNPQTNLIIAAVLTIVVIYALFQLLKSLQEPPLSIINGMTNENLMQHHAK
ncbi:MAG: WD1261 family protein [Wolbachia sp.]